MRLPAGNVSALSHHREVDLAERLCGVIPCADRVQFLKTGAGSDGRRAVRSLGPTTARDLVVGSGYFGWLDWSADDAKGVPEGTKRAFSRIPFDDIAALEAAVAAAGANLAAIVLEPVVERLPSKEWIARARELATSTGAVLIFDEIKTGFRSRDCRLPTARRRRARSRRIRQGDGEWVSALRGGR